LKAKIDGLLFERTALAKKPTDAWVLEQLIEVIDEVSHSGVRS
jgi:hypothetical protein